jgi:tubulin polyglutamylase TTLL5
MNTDTPLDLKIKGNMIADLLTIAGLTPLNNRYLDGGHSKYESRHYFKMTDLKTNQSSIDKFILREIQLEEQRRGDWRRLFPTIKNLKYKIYFESDRYFNRLLREKLLSRESLSNL